MTSWQVFSAVALRRLPELIPRMDPLHTKVQEIFSVYEVAKSRYSQHEMDHLNDISAKEKDETVIKETAQDRLDKWVKEKSTFEFGKYDDRLTYIEYLFLNQKFGTDIKDQWLLPQAMYDSKRDDSLIDTARRALLESFNIFNGFRIVSKIPSAVYSFRYPRKIVESTGYKGAKVFFLKAHLDYPSAKVLDALDSAKNANLKWLTRKEAMDNVHKKYMISFSQGLLHEERVDTDRVLERASKYADSLKTKQNVMSQ